MTDRSIVRRAYDWLFRDRQTGKLVVVQLPNLALWLFFAASAVRRFAHPHGAVGTVVSAVAVAALLWWAVDEVARGVNPFRRALGMAVALLVLVRLLIR
jgi:hypothetical protein